MTIYVSELPKNCDDCPCFYDESISCQASEKWLSLEEEDNFSRSTQRHPTCPLKSLAEHDKEVRKDVIEEIRALAIKRNNDQFYIMIDEILHKIGEKEC